MTHYDIVVVGGGVVGATAALALAKKTSLKIALIDAQPLSQSHNDQRVSAISLTSKTIFQNLHAWEKMVAQGVSPFLGMHVWEEKNNAKIDFNCADIYARELGFILQDHVMRTGLHDVLRKQGAIDFLCPTVLTSLKEKDDCLELITAEQKTLTTQLLVAADGAHSWVREYMGIELKSWDYEHTALVTTVKTEYPHQKKAWQCFMNSGPLAFLPLADAHTCSIVWSTSHNEAHDLMHLDDQPFQEKLTAAFMRKLGKITDSQTRFSFPLRMRHVRNYIKSRVVLIGDAAHTIHPLAGQGVNLGLLDAVCLADIIANACNQSRDFAAFVTLRRYERWRKSENAAMLAGVELLKKLFMDNKKWVCSLRDVGLNFTDKISFLKNFFVSYASGQRTHLPSLARFCNHEVSI